MLYYHHIFDIFLFIFIMLHEFPSTPLGSRTAWVDNCSTIITLLSSSSLFSILTDFPTLMSRTI